MLFGALIVAGGLASPVVTPTQQWRAMAGLLVGGRYFIAATLGWFATLLVLAAWPQRWQIHWLARVLLAACVIGVQAGWACLPYRPVDFQTSARAFDNSAPGTAVAFPGNPPPDWGFTLTKR